MSYQMQLFGFGLLGLGLGFGIGVSYVAWATRTLETRLRQAKAQWSACAADCVRWHRDLINTRTSLSAKNFRLRGTITHLRRQIRELEVPHEVVQPRPVAPAGAARSESEQARAAGAAPSPWESASGGEPSGAVPNEYSPASAEAMMRLWRESGTGIGVYVRLPNGNEPVYMGGMHDKVASSDTIEIAIGWLTQLKYEALLQEKGVPHGGHA